MHFFTHRLRSSGSRSPIALIIFVASIFIDLTPAVKWNPIRSIFRYIGNAFNSSVKTDISAFKSAVDTRLTDIEKKQNLQQKALEKLTSDHDNKEISRIRWEIIDFKNSIVNGVKHSRGQYRHILASIDMYLDKMESVDKRDDDYYHEVMEAGESIRTHYEKFKEDTGILYF